MASENLKSIQLTIVTPVALMAGRLQNLQKWIATIDALSVEVILIHDKKDEQTGIELRKMVQKFNDSKVIIIEGMYGGPGLARNAGLALAKGEWVCFWDSDDLPEVEDFFRMVKVADLSGAECAVGGFTTVHDVTGKSKSHALTEKYLDEIAINPGIWRFAFRRSTLEGLYFSNLLMAEDQLFLASFRIPSRKIEIYSKSVYQYFVGENFHLTTRKEALSDLPNAIKISFSLITSLSDKDLRFVSILLSRQVISAIRTGSSSSRLQVIVIFLIGIWKINRNMRKEILRNMFFVIWNRESIL
jgi:glycosyltransferase involved in cell wall biosynthesis